jgi:hypothetical protein
MKQTIMAVAAAWALTAGAAFGQGAIQMQVVNATTEKVQVSIEKPVGGGWDWQFINGRGHFEPVPLAQGLGDRLVSVRMSKFDPASATQPVLKVIFVSGIAGYDIVYTTGTQAEAVGTPVVVKGLMKGKGELSDDQKKAVEETLKMPATKGAGS